MSENLPIIDTHQHLWDLEKFRPPWIEGETSVLQESHPPAAYLDAIEGLNIVKAIYMEVDVAESDQAREAEYISELCKAGFVTTAAVVSGRPASSNFPEYLDQLGSNRFIKGFRQVLHTDCPAGFCLGEQFIKSMQLLGDRDLSFDLCMRPMELDDGVQLANLCPNTRFIVDHCGNADPNAFGVLRSGEKEPWHTAESWKKSMSAFARCENVICKISGIIARAPENWDSSQLAPIVNFCLDEFGPDRVIFGSDWPVCRLRAPLKEWVTALKEIVANRSTETQRKLLCENAESFYKVST